MYVLIGYILLSATPNFWKSMGVWGPEQIITSFIIGKLDSDHGGSECVQNASPPHKRPVEVLSLNRLFPFDHFILKNEIQKLMWPTQTFCIIYNLWHLGIREGEFLTSLSEFALFWFSNTCFFIFPCCYFMRNSTCFILKYCGRK